MLNWRYGDGVANGELRDVPAGASSGDPVVLVVTSVPVTGCVAAGVPPAGAVAVVAVGLPPCGVGSTSGGGVGVGCCANAGVIWAFDFASVNQSL